MRSRPFVFQAKQQGVQLNLELPLDVPERFVGDPTRLRQILANLTGNATKFTSKGKQSRSPSRPRKRPATR